LEGATALAPICLAPTAPVPIWSALTAPLAIWLLRTAPRASLPLVTARLAMSLVWTLLAAKATPPLRARKRARVETTLE
jgi:hypothetical protein